MKSYQELLNDILNNGESHDDRTGVGTRSVFGRQWRHSFADGFPLLTTKRVPLRWVFEELRWFLSGSTNVKDLQAAGVDIWDEWATAEQCEKFGRPEGELGPIYGHLWRNFGGWRYFQGWGNNVQGNQPGLGVDQIEELLWNIKEAPNSRRLVVSGWSPKDQIKVALPPCHTLWQVKCHGDSGISLHLYARSIDVFLGLPFNIASYAMLLCMIAQVTDRTPRDLIISFGDLHLYNNHVEQANEQLGRIPRSLPNISINNRVAGRGLEGLLDIRWCDIRLEGYNPYPKIAAEVAV